MANTETALGVDVCFIDNADRVTRVTGDVALHSGLNASDPNPGGLMVQC
ncbi:MAG: hypothetical protein OXE79_05195 [Acidimicrobiaceae bacterium]|nr:hypothetical protein [Acidimicrobiaceae bacterium]MCY4281075.1 hypothetical protein [Acidimicrobiaceae bacterium]